MRTIRPDQASVSSLLPELVRTTGNTGVPATDDAFSPKRTGNPPGAAIRTAVFVCPLWGPVLEWSSRLSFGGLSSLNGKPLTL